MKDNDSTALLDPSWMELRRVNDDNHSNTDYESDPSQSTVDIHTKKEINKFHSFGALRPILALILQLIILSGMILFLSWTSTEHRVVPDTLANFYLKYPSTTVTLIGSLLSVMNIKLFVEAVRFAIIVSLRGNKNLESISLYSLYGAITVCSRNLLFDLDRGRVRWTITAFAFFILFTVQTSAWTTILTPRLMLTPYPSSYMDIDFTSPNMTNGNYTIGFPYDTWSRATESGIAAAREGSTLLEYVSYSGSVFNGTSRGILPIGFNSNNWTRIEAIQQGFTANVTCKTTSPSDSNATRNEVINNGVSEIYLCCNCTSAYSQDGQGLPLLTSVGRDNYGIFAICPYWGVVDINNVITIYMESDLPYIGNKTCTIEPQILYVNVTYNNGGFIAFEPMSQRLFDVPANGSVLVYGVMKALSNNFLASQNTYWNLISDIFRQFVNEDKPSDSTASTFEFLRERMEKYIRGVLEYGATRTRDFLVQSYPTKSFPSTVYVQELVWIQGPHLRLVITVAPLAIMTTTIAVILLTLYKARDVDLDHIRSFDPMNTLHIIAACSSGNVPTILFPDYSADMGLFSKGVGVQLPEGWRHRGPAGFEVSDRRQ